MSIPAPTAQPYRVAFCITELQLGGAERCLVELATRLDRSRFLPAVISLAPLPSAGHDRLVGQLHAAAIEVRSLGVATTAQLPQAIARLRRELSAWRPDLIQSFLFHANVVAGLAAPAAGGAPLVTGIRVADRHRWRYWVERWATRRAVEHVCVSDDVKRFAAEQMKLPENKLEVISNGIDVPVYSSARPRQPAQLGLPEDARLLIYIGRLDAQKRVERVINAFAEIANTHSLHHLILAGDGPLRGNLQHLVQQHALPARIHFLGHRDDVPQLLAASDALLLASDYEGMPNVVLEAMAAGIPVVCRDVEGSEALLGAAEGGQLVRRADFPTENSWQHAFGDRLSELIADSAVRKTLGRANRRRATEEFGWNLMVAAYQQLYEQLLGQAAARRQRSR